MGNIGFCIIGSERDEAGTRDKRWVTKFRPTIAFALQQDLTFDELVLAYQPENKDLLKRIIDDIKIKRAEMKKTSFRIVTKEILFQNPYDFDKCYSVLSAVMKSLRAKDDDIFYINMNTGSHTMQFALYVMAKYDFPHIKLVQTMPGNNQYGKALANTTMSHAQEINLSWIKYPNVREDISKTRGDYLEDIMLVPTNHDDFRDDIMQLVEIGSETHDPIILGGPTGSGKTRIAKAIHSAWCKRMKSPGDRKKIPFQEINCAGLTPELAWSQIFGHVKGSFTGAHKDHIGIMELAHGGTLFLDEIGDLDIKTQAMLLKALETGEFHRLGDPAKKITSEFRLICATNKNIGEEINHNRFREDLYARLRSWEYILPGLTERRRDIEPNIDHELNEWIKEKQKELRSPVAFDKKARKMYLNFALSSDAVWTGNFRDLSQSVRRMATWASIDQSGGYGTITEVIVAREIAKLKLFWRGNIGKSFISDENIFRIIRERFKNQYASTPLMEALEKFMMDTAMSLNNENKAQVSKLLYGESANPTSKFNARANTIGRKTE